MKISVTYREIENYIAGKTGRRVGLSKVSDKEVCVSVSQHVIFKTIQIGINVRVDSISNDELNLTYDGGFGLDLIISGLMSLVKNKLPEASRYFEASDGHHVKIMLSKIDKLKSVLDKVSLASLNFTDDAVVLEARLK